MTRTLSVHAVPVAGGVDLRASLWDFTVSPYPRVIAYRRVGSSQSWQGDGDKLRSLAACLLDLAEQLWPADSPGVESADPLPPA